MRIKPACAVVAAVALAVIPSSTAQAHGDKTTFDNCTDAYEHGHSNILEGSEHYADKLDRDQDGKGCDTPPADFVEYAGAEDEKSNDEGEKELAETGGDDTTGYIAAGGGALLLAGAGTVLIARKRRVTR